MGFFLSNFPPLENSDYNGPDGFFPDTLERYSRLSPDQTVRELEMSYGRIEVIKAGLTSNDMNIQHVAAGVDVF